MKTCPSCHSGLIIKSGKIKGVQRYECKICSYHFTVTHPGKPEWMKRMAIHLYLEGLSIRKISRILDISDMAVGKWLKPVRAELDKYRKNHIFSREIHSVEHFMITRKLFQNFGWLVIGLEENEGLSLLGSAETSNCILQAKSGYL